MEGDKRVPKQGVRGHVEQRSMTRGAPHFGRARPRTLSLGSLESSCLHRVAPRWCLLRTKVAPLPSPPLPWALFVQHLPALSPHTQGATRRG